MVKYFRAAAKWDLIKLMQIFDKFKLPFWQLLMKELMFVLEKVDLDSAKNSRLKNKHQCNLLDKYDWANHRLFGSVKNYKILRRNSSKNLDFNDTNISIFNTACHPLLDAGLISIGAFIRDDNTQINYSDFFSNSMAPHRYLLNKLLRIFMKHLRR